MENVDDIIKKLAERYNKKEILIQSMFELALKDYNVFESKRIIEDFYKLFMH